MKTLKVTLAMFLALLMSMSLTFAQEDEDTRGAEEDKPTQVKNLVNQRLTEFHTFCDAELDLSEEQKAQIKEMDDKLMVDIDAIHTSNVSVKDKTNRLKGIAKDRQHEMKEILTEDQYNKMTVWQKNKMEETKKMYAEKGMDLNKVEMIDENGQINPEAMEVVLAP